MVGRQPAEARRIVFAVPKFGGLLPSALTDLFNRCQAAISADQSLVGHTPVYCRGIGKPLVLLGDRQMRLVQKKSFIVVDGTTLFIERAASGI